MSTRSSLLLLALIPVAACGSTSAATDGAAPADIGQSVPDLAAGIGDGTGPSMDLSSPPPQDFALVNGKAQPATQVKDRFLPDSAPWYRDVSAVPVAADSAAITQWMVSYSGPNGWGPTNQNNVNHGRMQVDFSLIAIEVPPGTPKIAGKPANGFFYSPDCDTAPIPLVAGGLVEGNTMVTSGSPLAGYNCGGFGGGEDCHILLVARAEKRLYEVYHATYDQGGLQTGCLAIWDTTKVDPNGRGQQCTSADAAGFPMSAMLFTAEELQAGEIRHAIRFILPNDMIRRRVYVAPATHGTNTTGPATSGPYGFRMRLKANYPLNNLSPAAQVVAKAMQKYGMLMSDGGNIALTAQSDALSSVKYSDLGFDSHSMFPLKATDFEVIEDTPTTAVGATDCERTPIAQ